MRVFVTGATGWVGSAVVRELIGAGHQVLGLARSDQSAKALQDAGVDVQRGEVENLDSLREGAGACDGVIHTAFGHDFSKFMENAENDRRAIEAIGEVLAGSDRPFVTTSGALSIAMVKPGCLGTEQDTPPASVPRMPSEMTTVGLAERGVRSSVMRLPPSVHGEGDQGFVPHLIDIARASGVAAYVGDGENRWPAVARLDAARAFRLALERGEAGSHYHAVSEEGIPIRKLAEVIGRQLGVPTASKSPDEAADHFSFLSMFIGLDAPTSSALTREHLGWEPSHPGLVADLEQGHYFDARVSKFSGS